MVDVLNAHPEVASIPDPSGYLPLHLSLRAGYTWHTGVKEIFEARPDVIFVRDHTSYLFSFMIAACKKIHIDHQPSELFGTKIDKIELNKQNAVDLSQLTTIFELLRRDPCVLNEK